MREYNKKIIFTSAHRMGDTLMMTPAFRFIKEHAHRTEIDVIALSELSGAILKHNPYISRLFVTPHPDALEKISSNYDLSVLLHHSDKGRQYLDLIDAPMVEVPPSDEIMHVGERAIRFAAQFSDGKLQDNTRRDYDLCTQPHHFQKIENLLFSHGIDLERVSLVGVHVGCRSLSKSHRSIWKRQRHKKVWPLNNFIQLIRRINQFYPSVKILLTGTREEKNLVKKISKKTASTINMVEQTSPSELACLMHYLKCFVCSDTGTLHVACTTDVNLICLMGDATDYRVTGPYPLKPNRKILYSPNLKKLSVERVFDALQKFLL